MTADAQPATPKLLRALRMSTPQSDWRPRFATGVLIVRPRAGLAGPRPERIFQPGLLGHACLCDSVGFARIVAPSGAALQLSASSPRWSYWRRQESQRSSGGESPWNGTFFFLGFVTVAAMLWSPRAGAVATSIAILIIAGLGRAGGRRPAGLFRERRRHAITCRLDRSVAGGAAVRSGHRCRVRTHAASIRGSPQPQSKRTTTLRERHADSADSAKAEPAPQVPRSREERASAIRDPSDLAARLRSLVATAFGYPFVALFLINERGRSVGGEQCGRCTRAPADVRTGPFRWRAIASRPWPPAIAGPSSGKIQSEQSLRRPEHASEPGCRSWRSRSSSEDRVLGVLELHCDAADAGSEPTSWHPEATWQSRSRLRSRRQACWRDPERQPRAAGDARAQDVRRSWESLLGTGALQYEVGEEGLPAKAIRRWRFLCRCAMRPSARSVSRRKPTGRPTKGAWWRLLPLRQRWRWKTPGSLR